MSTNEKEFAKRWFKFGIKSCKLYWRYLENHYREIMQEDEFEEFWKSFGGSVKKRKKSKIKYILPIKRS